MASAAVVGATVVGAVAVGAAEVVVTSLVAAYCVLCTIGFIVHGRTIVRICVLCVLCVPCTIACVLQHVL